MRGPIRKPSSRGDAALGHAGHSQKGRQPRRVPVLVEGLQAQSDDGAVLLGEQVHHVGHSPDRCQLQHAAQDAIPAHVRGQHGLGHLEAHAAGCQGGVWVFAADLGRAEHRGGVAGHVLARGQVVIQHQNIHAQLAGTGHRGMILDSNICCHDKLDTSLCRSLCRKNRKAVAFFHAVWNVVADPLAPQDFEGGLEDQAAGRAVYIVVGDDPNALFVPDGFV